MGYTIWFSLFGKLLAFFFLLAWNGTNLLLTANLYPFSTSTDHVSHLGPKYEGPCYLALSLFIFPV